MLALCIIMGILGWLVGVWLPWYIVGASVAGGLWMAAKEGEGLSVIPFIVAWLAYTVGVLAGALYQYGLGELGESLTYIFTGGS